MNSKLKRIKNVKEREKFGLAEATKVLGKISSVNFGFIGYQGNYFGLGLDFEYKAWVYGGVRPILHCGGVGTSIVGGWAYGIIDPDSSSKWNEADRTNQMAKMCKELCKILQAAKVQNVSDLVGKPVELVFDFNTLKDWRILEEVL